MTEYIITEEERKKMLRLWSIIQTHISYEQDTFYNLLDQSVQDAYTLMETVHSRPYQNQREGEYFPITKQELSLIKNDCYHPDTTSCEGCEFTSNDPIAPSPCTWKGANVLEEEILSRQPIQNEFDESTGRGYRCIHCEVRNGVQFCHYHNVPIQNQREKVLDELLKWRKEFMKQKRGFAEFLGNETRKIEELRGEQK